MKIMSLRDGVMHVEMKVTKKRDERGKVRMKR